MTFVDTHAHLEAVDDLDGVLNRAKNIGVGVIVTIGTSLETSKKAVKIAKEFSTDNLKIYAICGIHPKDGKSDIEKFGLYRCIKTLKQIAKSSKKVVGIGEVGLDHYLKQETGNKKQETSSREKKVQKKLFEAQIKLAGELKLPMVIHCRNGWEEIFSLLTTNYRLRTKIRGVFHSWTGDWDAVKAALDLGFYISFSGIVTFKNAFVIQDVARRIPLERVLVETDSPFLSPEPFRGKPNEPKNVKIVGKLIADLRGLPFDKISEVTTRNAQELFGI